MSDPVDDAVRRRRGRPGARPMRPIPASRSAPRSQAEDGAVFAGCNVENAAYPVGTCAEAGAIAAMVAGGGDAHRGHRRGGRGRAPW